MADAILQRQSELEKEVIAHILEEKALLSASQRRKFQVILDQFSMGGLGVHDIRGSKNGGG